MAAIPETIEEGEALGKAKVSLRAIMIVIAVVVCAGGMLIDTGLPEGVAPIIAITIVAVLFRFTETLPLHVTGLLVCALLVVLGGVPADKVFTNIFDPSVVLLFGGLVLAVMLQKYKLDSKLVCFVLNKPSYHPKRFLLPIMAVSAFLSMRMSNTAAAALMIPLALHVVSSCCRGYKEKNITKAAVIGTAYATTLGGMATVVGSPPNFIAASAIQKAGFQFGFVERFIHAFPVVVLLVLAAWFLLIKLFPIDVDRITMPSDMQCEFEQRKKQRRVIIIFCITVVGRLTTGYTGISSTIIALIPLFLGILFGLLHEDYLKQIDRATLILIGSGIALGNAMYTSGAAALITGQFIGVADTLSPVLLFLGLGTFSVLLTMFTQNTASAALMIPLITPLALQLGLPMEMILFVGMAVSLDFTAPMGTAPNAIAYSTGLISVKNMATAGLLLSLVSILVLTGVSLVVWGWW